MSILLPPCDPDGYEIVDLMPSLRESIEHELAELQAEANRTFRAADEAFGEAEDLMIQCREELMTRAADLRDAGVELYRTAGALQYRADQLAKRLEGVS